MYYTDVIMGAMAYQITSLTIVYSTVYSGAGQRKHQSSASLASVRGIHRRPVNSPHKGPVTRKMFPFNDVIMKDLRGTKPQLHEGCRWWFKCYVNDPRRKMANITNMFPLGKWLWQTLYYMPCERHTITPRIAMIVPVPKQLLTYHSWKAIESHLSEFE